MNIHQNPLGANNMSIQRLLTIFVTWGFLILNVFIAWIPSLATALLVVRDSWIFVLLIALFVKRSYAALFFLITIAAFGGVGFFGKTNEFIHFVGYFYGLRDFLLIVLISEVLRGRISLKYSFGDIQLFVHVVVFLALCEIVFVKILGFEFYSNLFNLSSYYANKGVEIELGFGLIGDRNGLPLYSPNLLCTLLSMYYFFDHRLSIGGRYRLASFVISVFTLTKVLPLTVIYYLARRRWFAMTLVSIIFFPIVLFELTLIAEVEPLLQYHLASIFGHMESFHTAFSSNIFDFFPSLLGTHSHAIANLSSEDLPGLMESLLLARVADLKFWSIFIIIYVFYVFYMLKDELARKIYFGFLLISLLTATSNQPVAWVPILILHELYKKGFSVGLNSDKNL